MTTATAYDWPRLAFTSHYETLVAIQEALRNEEFDEAWRGLEELTDAVSRVDRRVVKSHLIRLMAHVLKWKAQPSGRCKSWVWSILHARDEMSDAQEDTPSITDEVIEEMWTKSFERAKVWAERETAMNIKIAALTWQEVFEDQYEI